MHRSKLSALAVLMLASIPARPVLAHHSYAMFDMQKDITLEGTVKEFLWTNPHVWIQLTVMDAANGKEVEWSIEGNSPNMLTRAGWNRHALKIGDKATVVIHPVRVGGNSNSGSLSMLTVNGQRLLGGQAAAAGAETKP
jgi:hypothetical protein